MTIRTFGVAMLAALALAGCAEEAADDMVAEAPAGPASQAELLTVDGGTATGTFEATSADGTVVIQEVRADGTLANRMGDSTTEGSWTYDPASRQFCSQMDEADAPTCYLQGVTVEDGSWDVTNTEDPQDVWTIRRISG